MLAFETANEYGAASFIVTFRTALTSNREFEGSI